MRGARLRRLSRRMYFCESCAHPMATMFLVVKASGRARCLRSRCARARCSWRATERCRHRDCSVPGLSGLVLTRGGMACPRLVQVWALVGTEPFVFPTCATGEVFRKVTSPSPSASAAPCCATWHVRAETRGAHAARAGGSGAAVGAVARGEPDGRGHLAAGADGRQLPLSGRVPGHHSRRGKAPRRLDR